MTTLSFKETIRHIIHTVLYDIYIQIKTLMTQTMSNYFSLLSYKENKHKYWWHYFYSVLGRDTIFGNK